MPAAIDFVCTVERGLQSQAKDCRGLDYPSKSEPFWSRHKLVLRRCGGAGASIDKKEIAHCISNHWMNSVNPCSHC